MAHKSHKLTKEASRAAILGDGRVARRSRNYESAFDGGLNTTKKPYSSLPVVSHSLNAQTTSYGSSARDRILKYSFYITLVCIMATASYIYYNNNFRSSFSSNVMKSLQNEIVETSGTELELERIANLIIQDSDWNVELIDSFVEKWEELAKPARQNIYYTAWYQHFSFLLENMYKEQKKAGSFKLNSTNEYQDPLLTLALTVGVAEPIEMDEKLPPVRRNSSFIKKAKVAKIIKSTRAIIQSLQTAQRKETPKSITSNVIIREEAVNDVIGQYKDAYNQGNVADIRRLFVSSISSENNDFLDQLSASYTEAFDNSTTRSVEFNNIQWEYRDNKAFVSAEYNAIIQLKDSGESQNVVAKVEMELQPFQNNLRFANFRLIDPEITITKAASTSALPTKFSIKRRKKSIAPTRAELQDILVRFVDAYEVGDITLFDSLFSDNVASNDHNNINGIKDDYKDVFKNTSDRQMFIQNIQWTIKGDVATGIGQLDAIILPLNDGDTETIKGKIELVVKKSKNELMITHFYHTLY